MVWTTPMTAVANDVWTPAQYNTHIRDNLLASEAAVVSAAGQMVFSTALNTLTSRTPNNAKVATSETSVSTAVYADMATVGPQVTITTGTSALVYIAARMSNSVAGSNVFMSYAVTGATTIAASSDWSVSWDGATVAGTEARIGAWHYVSILTSGSNVFTAKYKVEANTGTFVERELIVFPL